MASIIFAGHGNPQIQCLSEDCAVFINGSTLVLSHSGVDTYGSLPEIIKSKFSQNGKFEFASCNSANGEKNISQKLSAELPGIFVTGGGWYVVGWIESPLFGRKGPPETYGPKKTYLNGNPVP